ncbi:hypothetical protein MCELHM10_00609 [Paracoccaceae bacterium]|jgi:hypothetical protein
MSKARDKGSSFDESRAVGKVSPLNRASPFVVGRFKGLVDRAAALDFWTNRRAAKPFAPTFSQPAKAFCK